MAVRATRTIPPPARLAEARELLDRATRTTEGLTQAARRAAAVDRHATLPVAPELAGLFAGGGIRKGSTLATGASTALLLGLIAETSARDGWCGLVGFPQIGIVAAHEAGVSLERLALVPDPGDQLVAVTSALLEGMDIVAIGGQRRVAAGDRQRLAAKARQAGAVLISYGMRWPGADLEIDLHQDSRQWQGLCGGGHGRLWARRVHLRASGRGEAHQPRRATVLLPGPDGRLASATPTVAATSARSVPSGRRVAS